MKRMIIIQKCQEITLAAMMLLVLTIVSCSKDNQHDHSDHAKSKEEWTCSMHPQIRKPGPGKCPICGMDLIPIETKQEDSNSKTTSSFTMSREAIALANVRTTVLKNQSQVYELDLTGKVNVNEQRISLISANFSGRIEQLYVDFTGQSVRRGQKLVTIYSPDLITAQRELLEASSYKEINPTLYHAVREKLLLWKITKNQINAIEKSGRVLSNIDVYSDTEGVVLKRTVSRGDIVNKGEVLFEIANLNTVWVLFDAYEADLPWIKVGRKISFTLSALPGKTYTAKIQFVDPIINPQTRTAAVRVETTNPGLLLKPEMFVSGKIESKIPSVAGSIMIPKTAVLWTGKKSVVYVKDPNNDSPTFEIREITLGPASGNFQIVEAGLNEGEEIVTQGAFAIDSAMQLRGNKSMMNRSETTIENKSGTSGHQH